MAKQTKRTKKFVKNNLDRTIKERKDRQKKNAQIARAGHGRKAKALKAATKHGQSLRGRKGDDEDEDEEEGEGPFDAPEHQSEQSASEEEGEPTKDGRMTVEDFMGGGFKDEVAQSSGSEDDEILDDENDSLSDVEDLSDDEDTHVQDLAKLAEKDPEFFKYLQENDEDLLHFGEEEEDLQASDPKGKRKATEKRQEVVTLEKLKEWQKSILKTHSLRAFRRLLLAFRAAAHMGAEDEIELAYLVNDAKVFNKLILTTLKYVPVVLQHHLPYKQLPSGKFKLPTNSKKFGSMQRSLQSFFSSLHRLLRTLPEPKLLYVCVDESTRMVPYLLQNRRMTREYVKILLDLWATSQENVCIVSFLGIRKAATAGDEDLLNLCLRGVYRGLVRGSKTTTIHNIEHINLMKNSASELFAIDLNASYQQAFGFIRQLAMHLRTCLKAKTPESYQNVYNWQYIHCIDFWAIVLATTCDKERSQASGQQSPMHPLIYPLVQAATGAIRLIPTSRYFPLRMHLVQSMLRLMNRTGTYIPLASTLVEILEAPEFARKAKPSTLTPLNFDVLIRAPKAYVRTRVYADQLGEETTYLILEYLNSLSRSIAFPELVIPIVIGLKRALKLSRNMRDTGKVVQLIKNLIDKIGRHSDIIREHRQALDYAPRDEDRVQTFLQDTSSELPIEAAARLARRSREKRKALLQTSTVEVDAEMSE